MIWAVLRTLRRSVFLLLFLLSVLINIALVVSVSVFEFASSVVEDLTGKRYLAAQTSENFAEMTNDLDAQKRANRELRSDLASANADLVAERQMRRELRSELAETAAELAAVRAAKNEMREAVFGVSERVERRLTRTATRETAAMAGESLPFWGVAVITTATALELHDMCQTIVDMNELRAVFDPSAPVSADQLTVCGMEVPSRQELLQSISESPANAWEAARGAMPTLEDIKDLDVTSIDFAEYGRSVSEGAVAVYDSAAGAAAIKWEQLRNWWDKPAPPEIVHEDN